MRGLMQDWPLTVDRIIDHAARWHGAREIAYRRRDGTFAKTSYLKIRDRARRVSSVLQNLGVSVGDRIATLAWNTPEHMETWYGIMGIGAICHTLNPRLFADQLVYIVTHAGSRVLFTEPDFLPFVRDNLARMPCVEKVMVYGDEAAAAQVQDTITYEAALAGVRGDATAWGGFDEDTACGLCYTSGTTGNPKGVLYSHRSNFLHALTTLQSDLFGLSERDVVLPVVPMFHANAWGLTFAAPAVGAKMVFPGSRLDGESVFELIEAQEVTFSAAVPTVWQSMLQHLRTTGQRLTTLRRVIIGGSACPENLIRAFHDDYGVEVLHLWGMTELSPVGTVGAMTADMAARPLDEQMPLRLKQGRPPLGVDLALFDDANKATPNDGKSVGRLKVRGMSVTSAYLGSLHNDALDENGWFDTGDIAAIDQRGFVQITDRAKDVIKSGGEWISSIEIENIAVGHPDVAVAAVIGRPHPKWDERPLLLIQPNAGCSPTEKDLLSFLDGKIANWWMPDAVVVIDKVPIGSTGKIDKKELRAMADRGAFEPGA